MDPDLVASVSSGDVRSLSRAITLLEAGVLEDAPDPPSGVIGLTGPPGVGKSTLLSGLIAALRSRGETVAALAVDPSSPITGGALLGDRIRMQSHIDDSVFVRSMAARGRLGGLAEAAGRALGLMTQAGFDRVLVETVGVGQSEVEVIDVADVVVLVLVPEFGDQMQADKAGIMEIADVYVVNKADRPGADEAAAALRGVAEAKGAQILKTVATDGSGVPELTEAIVALVAASSDRAAASPASSTPGGERETRPGPRP